LLIYKALYVPDNLGELTFSLDELTRTVLLSDLFWEGITGTLYYVFFITLPQVVIGTIMAFVFAKFKFMFKNVILFVYCLLLLMPFQVLMVPSYLTLNTIGLLNTSGAVILPQIFLPFGVLFLRYLMAKIPNSIIDAAKIDGASTVRIFFSIVIPSVKNGIILLFFFSFIDNWNLVEPILMFNKDSGMNPLTVIMRGVMENAPESAFVIGLLYMIPAIVIFIFIRKNIIKGMDVA
jgi:multiple sugar transport system permease protein